MLLPCYGFWSLGAVSASLWWEGFWICLEATTKPAEILQISGVAAVKPAQCVGLLEDSALRG